MEIILQKFYGSGMTEDNSRYEPQHRQMQPSPDYSPIKHNTDVINNIL